MDSTHKFERTRPWMRINSGILHSNEFLYLQFEFKLSKFNESVRRITLFEARLNKLSTIQWTVQNHKNEQFFALWYLHKTKFIQSLRHTLGYKSPACTSTDSFVNPIKAWRRNFCTLFKECTQNRRERDPHIISFSF